MSVPTSMCRPRVPSHATTPGSPSACSRLAAFNLTYRLGLESVGEWDESLYALSAWELVEGIGSVFGTTRNGVLDYYNTKPPLNVWLIASSFWAAGVNLVSLRLHSVVAAWATVAVLLWWTRQVFGPAVSILSGLVLSTLFGFLHLHSGRSGNPDALLTLLLLLSVVTLWSGQGRPWRLVWMGPLAAGVFMLKGMAVLLPIVLVVLAEAGARRRERARWKALAVAFGILVLVVGAWAVGRWQVDGFVFFERMLSLDFVGVSVTQLERHERGPLFYLDVLQRHHYEWLLAAGVTLWLLRRSWRRAVDGFVHALRGRDALVILFGAWLVVTLVVPTMMQTRIAWYLNSFYPLFAVLVGLVLASGLSDQGNTVPAGRRRVVVASLLVLAVLVAQSKTLWRLHRVTNFDTSVQGLLLANSTSPPPTRVFRDTQTHSEEFFVKAVMGREFLVVASVEELMRLAEPGDLFVSARDELDPSLHLVGQTRRHRVYRVQAPDGVPRSPTH